MSDATLEVIKAARLTAITDSDVASAGVYFNNAPRTAGDAYVILTIQYNHPVLGLGRSTMWRDVTLLVKACAKEASGVSGLERARTLADKALAKLKDETVFNTYLAPLNWSTMIPIELSAVPPFREVLKGDADGVGSERWTTGNMLLLKVQPI